MSPQGLCVSPDHHRQRYGTLSTLCRSKALSWVMDGRITVRSGYGLPPLQIWGPAAARSAAAENTTVFRVLIFSLYLSGQFMGLALKVAHAKLPGLYESHQTKLHTRCEFSRDGKVVLVHNTKAYWRTRGTFPVILYLGTRWRWVVKFTPLPLYPWERTPVPTEQEVRSTPEAVQRVLEKRKSLAPTVQPREFCTFSEP
jgi:hypothetical protein